LAGVDASDHNTHEAGDDDAESEKEERHLLIIIAKTLGKTEGLCSINVG
jgi:hypothetical protein